jgi:hypothetical protein
MVDIPRNYRILNVFLLAVALGVVAMQDRIIAAILPFIPQTYQELISIIVLLLFLGLREVVKVYGQKTEETPAEVKQDEAA